MMRELLRATVLGSLLASHGLAAPCSPPADLGIDLATQTDCDPLVPERCLLPLPTTTSRSPTNSDHDPPADRLHRRGSPEELPGQALRRGRARHPRRLQPRIGAAALDAHGGPRPLGSPSAHRHRPLPRRRFTDRRHRHALRKTVAGLGRVRHECAGREPRAGRPAGHQLPRWPSLRRRLSPPGRRRRAPPCPRHRPSRLSRRPCTTDARFEARRRRMERLFTDLPAPAWRAASCSSPGTSPLPAESLTGRMLAMRDDAFAGSAPRRRVFTVDTVTENPNPAVRRRVRAPSSCRSISPSTAGPGQRLRRSTPPASRSGSRAPFTARTRATCRPPPPAAGAHGPLRARPARRPRRGQRLLVRRMSATYNIAYCATDWYRHGRGGHRQRRGGADRPLRLPDRSPTACSRESSTSSSSGRLMTPPATGLSATPAFQLRRRSRR